MSGADEMPEYRYVSVTWMSRRPADLGSNISFYLETCKWPPEAGVYQPDALVGIYAPTVSPRRGWSEATSLEAVCEHVAVLRKRTPAALHAIAKAQSVR